MGCLLMARPRWVMRVERMMPNRQRRGPSLKATADMRILLGEQGGMSYTLLLGMVPNIIEFGPFPITPKWMLSRVPGGLLPLKLP